MTALRVGIIGSGKLAQVRGDALAAQDGVEVVAVASRRLGNAERLAGRWNARATADHTELTGRDGIDAVLVAVPHRVQDDMVGWALAERLHTLAGGPLATTSERGRQLTDLAARHDLILEAGYEARYKSVWHSTRELLGRIGAPVSVQTVALFDQDPQSWYYDQQASGGMLVTHLTYAFLNPLRWLLGRPRVAAALGNTKRVDRPGSIRPETCTVLLDFPSDIACSMTASYVKPGNLDGWQVTIVGTEGGIELFPGDLDGGHLVYTPRVGDPVRVEGAPDGFDRQVAAFRAAARTGTAVGTALLNPAGDALEDLLICDEIELML
ncbi:Gfo/Idh/MocA family protein [Actinoplanes sp. M2I2]|uniref:Gfo/Idh/MocA family protein n=1 Tax=Actinoplanes sp. M2I2 TaxID=1734444 RepID=UPI002020D2DF|nr:Gfo/Idh/MocA family oxidoreductase [Actinoplanes sp. M2I2]